MNTTLQILRYVMRDLARSRWLLGYGGFFLIVTWALLRFSDTEMKALLSIANVMLLVVPLANIVFGAMYLYASREFVELLLAQPVRRPQLFIGLYLGLVIPLSIASVVGTAIPLAAGGVQPAAVMPAMMIALSGTLLTATFVAIAAVIAFRIEDRVRGLATAFGVWLLLAIVYDGLVLMAAMHLADYPLERPMLAMLAANPIDLARLLLLTQFDVAAMLGYTGAVFQRYIGGSAGALVALGVGLLWIVAPAALGGRLFHRKDF